ncbi:aldehyde dehydrogenase (NAD+) [Deinobacterium chartae]|uniref:Aldehyde dehydrogenase n=1 Tax=Deinobacterium chartae TaxID=521158 RepID=A0A841HXK0_9DEIO|nr:aldehyde dehydrogenase family protein [Deinobacterium chartae]MBB6096682.1 aldehyde dehydrogenase (NAD+) [Deinobacterium chartae]
MTDPTPAELRELFERQRVRAREIARQGPEDRLARLQRLREALLAHRAELRAALWADLGKAHNEVDFTEITPLLGEIRHARAHLRGWMRPRRVPSPLALPGARSEVRYEPRGVVLILAPWNYPLLLQLAPLVSALAAGNTAVLRPSERAPHTAAVLEAMIARSFDPAEVAVVSGDVPVAEALLELPFDHIFFTGSTAVGRRVMAAAARHLTPVTLELGGKSPAIVAASADLELAARRLAWGKLLNVGQTCVSPDHVWVQRSLEARFVRAYRAAVQRLYGPPEAWRGNPDLGRMVSSAAVERLRDLTQRSLEAGARLELGGDFDPAARYVAPTLVSRVSPDMPLMSEELFGPVLPVLGFDDLTEPVRTIGAMDTPLALYVFARDPQLTERVLGEVRSGGAVVNDTIVHLANPALPFGGQGASGMGNYHGFYGFRTFSHERAVMQVGRASLFPLVSAPYRGLGKRVASALRRWMD